MILLGICAYPGAPRGHLKEHDALLVFLTLDQGSDPICLSLPSLTNPSGSLLEPNDDHA